LIPYTITIDKILIWCRHNKNNLLPLGMFGKEVIETRDKHYKKHRQDHSRTAQQIIWSGYFLESWTSRIISSLSLNSRLQKNKSYKNNCHFLKKSQGYLMFLQKSNLQRFCLFLYGKYRRSRAKRDWSLSYRNVSIFRRNWINSWKSVQRQFI